jgi:hypothetical protein
MFRKILVANGTVGRVAVTGVSPVDGGDLLLVVDPAEQTRDREDS